VRSERSEVRGQRFIVKHGVVRISIILILWRMTLRMARSLTATFLRIVLTTFGAETQASAVHYGRTITAPEDPSNYE